MEIYLLTIIRKCEFCILARPRDWIKLQTVAEGSNLITRLQLWTSKPSSNTEVATMMFTCSACMHKKIFKWKKFITTRSINKWWKQEKLTLPSRNSSMVVFCSFLLWDCVQELDPAVYAVFHPLDSGSHSFNRFLRTIAVIILSTKMIHLKSLTSLPQKELHNNLSTKFQNLGQLNTVNIIKTWNKPVFKKWFNKADDFGS